MASVKSARDITARLTSQAAPNLDILHSLGDIFARAASGYLQDSQLAKDMFEMQEQWIADTAKALSEDALPGDYEQTVIFAETLRSQLKKLHGYIYVNSTPAVP